MLFSLGALPMTTPEPLDVSATEAAAAWAHLETCGPLCAHVEFCPRCVDVYGLCAAHAKSPQLGVRFKRGAPLQNRP